MATLSFRNRAGELVDLPTVPATRLKNETGSILDQAAASGAVAITKHNATKAVLLSVAEFEALTRAATPELDELTDEFDALLQQMQTPRSKAGVAAAFDATGEDLGAAAVRMANPPS